MSVNDKNNINNTLTSDENEEINEKTKMAPNGIVLDDNKQVYKISNSLTY